MILNQVSSSYPFYSIAKHTGVPYGEVLTLVEQIDHPDPAYAPYFATTLPLGVARLVEQVCHADWRWDMTKMREREGHRRGAR